MRHMCSDAFVQIIDKLATADVSLDALHDAWTGQSPHQAWSPVLEVLNAENFPSISWNKYKKQFELYVGSLASPFFVLAFPSTCYVDRPRLEVYFATKKPDIRLWWSACLMSSLILVSCLLKSSLSSIPFIIMYAIA